MSISRLVGTFGIAAALVLALTRCSPGPALCNRYSDCDPGLTCAYGRCVYPPLPSDGGGDGAALTDAGSPIDATGEAAEGSDSATADEATTGDDGSSDDSSGDDASSD